jgi:hypothetical protein
LLSSVTSSRMPLLDKLQKLLRIFIEVVNTAHTYWQVKNALFVFLV